MRHSPRVHVLLLLMLWLGLAACQIPGRDGGGQAAAESASSDVARFDREMRKKGCELLTADLVAATFGVPADALMQSKLMGCQYRWDGDEETLEVSISMLRAHDREAGAASWFATATRNRTAEEMQAEMDQVAERLDESEQLDTELKKSTAQDLLKMAGVKAITFEDVAGVGDEARVSDDGTVYVRVDNLTFMVSAYKGPKAPPVDLQGLGLQEMAAVGKEHAAQWAMKTAPQRKTDGIRLADAIVAAL